MLRPGDKVNLTVYDNSAGGQVQEPRWVVLEYDNGLVKVKRGDLIKIYNMRSLGFFAVEVERD